MGRRALFLYKSGKDVYLIFLFCLTGPYSDTHDRTGFKERNMGGTSELSFSNQLDVKTRKNLRRCTCSG